MPDHGQPDQDEEARKAKAAENPLLQYFGGGTKSGLAQQQAPRQPMMPQAPAAPPAAAPKPATNVGAGAAPTNFTNFSRVQSANQAVSNREAAGYASRAANNAERAGEARDALRRRFSEGVGAGTVAGPEMGFAADDGSGVGLHGQATRATLGAGVSDADVAANAGRNYSGPGSLGDVAGVEDVYGSTLGAQQGIDALGNPGGLEALIQQRNGGAGGSALSSALIGGAGRKDFAGLRARFNPEQDLRTDETNAAAQAKAAGEASAANAGKWGELSNQRANEAQIAADQAATQAGNATTSAAALHAYEDAQKALPPLGNGQRKTWATERADMKPGLIQTWSKGLRPELVGKAASSYNGMQTTTPWAANSTGIDAKELESLLSSMSEDEYSRFSQLKTAEEKGQYLVKKYAVAGAKSSKRS